MPAKNAINLKDQIFGYWKVLERDEEKTKQTGNAYWKCKCLLCENEYSIRGGALRDGSSTKCTPCARLASRKNELNKIYGQLTVVKDLGIKNKRNIWLCQCSCNNFIEVSGTDLRTGKVQSCGKCPDRRSLGEKEIASLLTNNNINFIIEYTFKDFLYSNGVHPRYDFYIPDKNYVIEFDGKQHYFYYNNATTWNTEENLKKTQKRDNLKNEYCWNNNIPIIRIPYTLQSKITIEDLLLETSQYIVRKE